NPPANPPETAPDDKSKDAPPADPAPNTLNLTSEQLNERLERAKKSTLKELGIKSPEELKELRAKLEAMEKAQQEAERAKLSEAERMKSDLEERERRIKEIEAEGDRVLAETTEAERRAALGVEFVARGIKHVDYAMFKVENTRASLARGEEFGGAPTPDKVRVDPRDRFSLGVARGPPEPPALPANTTPGATGPDPDPRGQGAAQVANSLAKGEFHRRLNPLGLQ